MGLLRRRALPSPAKLPESPAVRGREEKQPLRFHPKTPGVTKILPWDRSTLFADPDGAGLFPGCPGSGSDGGAFVRGPSLAPRLPLPGGIFPRLRGGPGG